VHPPSQDGKCDHTIGCHRRSDTNGAPLAGAGLLRCLVQIGHVHSQVGFVYVPRCQDAPFPLNTATISGPEGGLTLELAAVSASDTQSDEIQLGSRIFTRRLIGLSS
jgi:hypothetical protein